MKKELSILIPVYNYDCTQLAQGLCRQMAELELAEGARLELIVAEDGSSVADTLVANAQLATLPRCHYIRRNQNVGRAAIRNFLARQSQYQWLLFLDCDMQLPGDHFLRNYLCCEGQDVVDGGFGVAEAPSLQGHNLRYSYEWSELKRHSVEQRRANPYRSFRTTNFMIRRDIMLNHPFDERFLHYGYEDVLFGKELKQHQIAITHIDNAMLLTDLETNDVFVSKTEEALRTLHQFRSDLRGYSRLLTLVEGIHLGVVRGLIKLVHRLAGPLLRRNLCGRHPSLRLFKIYKLGYYLTLTKNDKRQ
ncbi:MAG: glycosyltransferase family 2 protein [Prevotella sp.]|nr:glycosyltransferase family 2 protein [Prevotella sp.]